jgi:asparagine synthetase B (glutamine-hydrolysing)
VNLFVLGWSGERSADASAPDAALRRLLERLPFFPGRPVETWAAPSGTLAAAWITHGPEQTGGVSYARAEASRLALFSGRPVHWTDEREADGRGPLDPAFYLEPSERWADSLDGRFAAARYDDADRTLEVASDAMGAYPIYEAHADGVRWTSNNAELLRDLAGARELEPSVLAPVLGGGWSLSGDPVWSGVRRVTYGCVRRLAPGKPAGRAELLPLPQVASMLGSGFDAARAGAVLVEGVRALADWPMRPSVVPVTGGRDSRVVLGAALRSGIRFESTTGGDEASPDVQVGRQLAEVGGVAHSILEHDPHGSVWDDWRRAAEIVDLTSSGTASLADAAGFPLGPREGSLVLWHSGQGGEIARSYYGTGEGLDRDGLAALLARRFLGQRPGRADVLSDSGRALVREQIGGWVDRQLGAGVDAADVPDMFYLQRRMGTWAGPSHGCVEYVRDTTSPLWSRRLLPDELGLPAGERARQLFHLRVLQKIAPELVEVPFEDGRGWPARRSAATLKVERARELAGKAAAEARRRALARRQRADGPAPGADDPFARVLPEIRDTVLSQPGHQAWAVLDRARAERLLNSPPAALDTMSRYYAWRLATVFGAMDPARC